MFGFENPSFGGSRLWIVDKGLTRGGFYDTGMAPEINIYDPYGAVGLQELARTIQPAHVFGSAAQDLGTFLVSYDGLSEDLTYPFDPAGREWSA